MFLYWKHENNDGTVELHVQSGFEWGNDLTCRRSEEEAEWGTYCPMSDEEHTTAGYVKIERDEAEELAETVNQEIAEDYDAEAAEKLSGKPDDDGKYHVAPNADTVVDIWSGDPESGEDPKKWYGRCRRWAFDDDTWPIDDPYEGDTPQEIYDQATEEERTS